MPLMMSEESTVKANVGTVDRALRIVVGLVLIGLTVTGRIGVWGWIGVVPLVTGAVRVCPLYSMLGLKTCPAPKADPK